MMKKKAELRILQRDYHPCLTDIFTLKLMPRFSHGKSSCGLLGHPALVTASFYIAPSPGCAGQAPLGSPSLAALLFLSSYVTEANKLEMKRLPGEEHKISSNGSHRRTLQPVLSIRGQK